MIGQVKAGIRSLLPKNTFARSVSVLVGGTAGGQVLLVLVAPVLTRLYAPEDFGLLAVYASLLAIIGVVSSLRYELAIPLPESDAEAANIAVLSLLLVVGSTFLSALAVLLFSEAIAALLGVPQIADYLWLLSAGILLGGTYTVFNHWCIRTKQFTMIAATTLRQALATIAIQLTAFKLGGIALLFGQIAGQSVGSARLGKSTLTNPAFAEVNLENICRAARRYRRFPMFTTWAGLLNSGGTQLPPLMFAALFGPAAAGIYILAHRVLTLPVNLVGGAIRHVFFSGAAAARRSQKLRTQVESVLDKLVQISMPPIIMLAIIGPELFSFTFGEQWRPAGQFAQWMTPWLFLQFCTGPLTVVFAAVERQHIGLFMQGQLFLVRAVMIFIGALIGDLLTTVKLFSIGSALSYLVFLLMILRAVKAPSIVLLRSLSKALLLSMLVVSPLLLVFVSGTGAEYATLLVVLACLFLGIRYMALVQYDF
jgi:O-antigen/teichoic acid export membrane protein